jgi:peptide/nickel transport system substrate-binding protein
VVSRLEEGVKFHDGSAFNAEAVKYQIEWIQDKKNKCWNRAYLRSLKSVEVMDAYTLKWHFKEPWAAFPGAVLAGIPGWPVSAEALKKDSAIMEYEKLSRKVKQARKKVNKEEKKAREASGEKAERAAAKVAKAKKQVAQIEARISKLKGMIGDGKITDQNPVGTGAYILEDANPGNYLKVKRNPDWWYGKKIGKPDMPYFDGIITIIIPDPAIQLANLRAGKIDTMSIDKSMYNLVKNDKSINVYTYPFNAMSGLRFNHAQGPCKDIRVRKAVSHALDRKALIAGTQFGMGRIASCMYPGDHWCHNPELKPVTYDPELSKKLLAEAGYTRGLTLKGYMSNVPAAVVMGEAIKGMLAAVGINWQMDALDSAAATGRMRALDYDLAGGGYAWIWEPDLMATNLYHPDGGFNYGRSNNERAIALIEAGKRVVDRTKRKQVYWDLERVLYENYEDVWLWWHIAIVAYSKNVQGFNNEMQMRWREGYDFSHPLWFKDGKP